MPATGFIKPTGRKFVGGLVLAALLSTLLPGISLADTLAGRLTVLWGDQAAGQGQVLFQLALENGRSVTSLSISQSVLNRAGGIDRINGQLVTVETNTSVSRQSGSSAVVNSVQVQPGSNNLYPLGQITGATESRRFVSIMCKFSDVAVEEQGLAFFEDMYGSDPGQLNHYWKEVSSDEIDVTGSTAHGWYTLDKPNSYYTGLIVGGSHGNMLDELFTDCVSLADNDIDFSTVYGINLMFNATFGSYAWGGGKYATLDGVSRVFPATWEPPWAWKNVTVMAHEMGHSFSLPHSNNSDGDFSPYDNPWTVMSDTWSYTNSDSVYGTIGQHLNVREKNQLGWLESAEIYNHTSGDYQTITIDPLNFSNAGTGAYRAAFVPVSNSPLDSYSIEVRTNDAAGGLYEGLPGSGVIIHSVDNARNEPAWLIDADTPAATNGDTDGVMWVTGEVFEDAANGVRIEIGAKIGDGYQVSIGYQNEPVMVSPVPATTLTSDTETFTWQGNADQWWLYVGSAVGAKDIYDSGNLNTSTSTTVNALPTNGSAIYVRLFYKVGSNVWQYLDSTYTAAAVGITMVSPVPASTLSGTTETFEWTGSGIDQWWLYIGSAVGASDIHNSGNLSGATSNTVSGLPTDASTLYVRLYYKTGAAAWQSIDYTYTAASQTISMLAPAPGSVLTSATETFEWTGAGVSNWWLYIGSSAGTQNIYDSGNLAGTTTVAVGNLPVDGSTLHVRLWYRNGSAAWQHIDYTYTASSAVVMEAPTPSAVLSGSTESFQWSGSGVDAWWLYVGTSQGSSDVHDSGSLGASTSTTVTGLPLNGGTVYVRLFYKYGAGNWQRADYTYTAAGSGN